MKHPILRPKNIALSGLILLVAGLTTLIVTTYRSQPTPGTLRVTATYYPLYDFAKNIGGNLVSVANMTPAGAEPHDYEPTPQALATAERSQVFIYNGGTLEPWAHGFLQDYQHTVVQASRGIALEQATGSERSTQKIQDPHFWLDPVLAKTIITNIRDGLIAADPTHRAVFTKNAHRYLQKLTALDVAFRNALANCATRTIVTSHDAFSYLGKRYHLTIASIAGLSPDEEPSAARLAQLSALVRAHGIQYIFFESLVSPRLAATIATETQAKTLVFDPIEGLSDADQKQGKNYLTIQQQNLQNLRTALGCR